MSIYSYIIVFANSLLVAKNFMLCLFLIAFLQDSFLPPHQRTSYECEKEPTGPLDRKKLIEHINKQALETPDIPDLEPYVAGVVRGKKWIPPPQEARMQAAEEQIAIDLGDEYEQALTDATQEEIIDLAAILGFHQMVNVKILIFSNFLQTDSLVKYTVTRK